jgi:hypothetical protein
MLNKLRLFTLNLFLLTLWSTLEFYCDF